MTGPSGTTTYAYNGLGDRLQETVNGVTTTFTLDLTSGLTQVLDDGTNTYLYGNGRIAQTNGSDTEYFLGDALGSVRQLTDASGAVTLAENYDPFGNAGSSLGSTTTPYGFTGEQTDPTGMVYLRARYYDPGIGRFMTRDTWGGDERQPMSYNSWLYVDGNPTNRTDPSGHTSCWDLPNEEARNYCEDHGGVPGFDYYNEYGITMNGFISEKDEVVIRQGVRFVGEKMYNLMCITDYQCKYPSPGELFKAVYGNRTFTYHIRTDLKFESGPHKGELKTFCQRETSPEIGCYNNSGQIYVGLIAHELGHEFAARMVELGFGDPGNDMQNASIYAIDEYGNKKWVTGYHYDCNGIWKWERGFNGYNCDHAICVYHGTEWDDYLTSADEEFADMFANWIMDEHNYPSQGFTHDYYGYGNARRTWMDNHIFTYLYPLAIVGPKIHK